MCSAHMQIMSAVMNFVPLEQEKIAGASNCSVDAGHALASKFCNKCNMQFCLKCAFEHVSHGVIPLESKYLEWRQQVHDRQTNLEKQIETALQEKEVLRNELKQMQKV